MYYLTPLLMTQVLKIAYPFPFYSLYEHKCDWMTQLAKIVEFDYCFTQKCDN